MVVHQNITNLAGYFHFLNVRKIPYVIELTKCFVMLALVFYMVYFFPQESFILTTEHFALISFCITKGVTNEYGS